MQSVSSFAGFGRVKMTQPSDTTTNRQLCASAIVGDTESQSPASPTAGCPSCHPEEEAPSLVAVERPGRYDRRRPEGNHSIDSPDERSTARRLDHQWFPPRVDAAARRR